MLRKLLIIIFILGVSLILTACTKKTEKNNVNHVSATEIITGAADIKIKEKADRDLAIAKAKELWRAAIINGEDLSQGPCLSNEVIPGWVADIAHNPRQEVDNLPVNQCSAYRQGTAQHFVELDPEGNLIRAQ